MKSPIIVCLSLFAFVVIGCSGNTQPPESSSSAKPTSSSSKQSLVENSTTTTEPSTAPSCDSTLGGSETDGSTTTAKPCHASTVKYDPKKCRGVRVKTGVITHRPPYVNHVLDMCLTCTRGTCPNTKTCKGRQGVDENNPTPNDMTVYSGVCDCL